jgi:GT2 family glycosyltransferase
MDHYISEDKSFSISVVVINWNGKCHLEQNLSSVLSQTYSDFEVIVVDNGSTDGSQEYIRNNFPSVRLICLDKNYGFCKGNNEGIKAAHGDYIVLLNNDTVVEPDWLQNLYNAAVSDNDIGICASKMLLYSDKKLLDSAGDGFSICGAGFKRGHLGAADKYADSEYVFGASGGAALYKREMLEKIGLLDEDFFAIYEDVDLSFRAQLSGYKCKYVPEAVVYHKINSTIVKMSDFYVYHGQRNVEYAYFKNMPAKLIWKTLLFHLLYNLLGFIHFTLKGKGIVFLKAKIDFIKNFRNVMGKRKEIKQLKIVDDKYLWNMFEKKWLSTRLKGK